MDEKVKNDSKKVMLVQSAADGKIKAVTDIDKDGNIQTVKPTNRNLGKLLDVNTQESFLEAFLKKFIQQASDPSRTGFSQDVNKVFIMTEDVLSKLIKINLNPEELEKYRIDPAVELQKCREVRQEQGSAGDETAQSFQPYDTSKIDLQDLEKKGIRMEDLEPHLRAMSFHHKSPGLIDMNPEIAPGVRIPIKGRASLEEQPDGTLKVIPHYWQEKANLDVPFYGIMLPDDVKANIEQTRHAGRILDLELTPGEKTPCFVSRDGLTNTLEYMPVSEFNRQDMVKGKELSEGNKLDVYSGRKMLLEGFTTRAGYKRDAYIQVDAANRNFDFSYEGLDRNRYAQTNKETRSEKMAEKKSEGRQTVAGTGERKREITSIPKTMYGTTVPAWAHEQWSAAHADPSKRTEVKACYMKDMSIDGQGQPISRWVKPNWEKGKFDFFKWNPDYAKRHSTDVRPTDESRVQHAVNTEGQTVEAAKGIRGPLKPGQQRPADAGQNKPDEHQQHQRTFTPRQSAPQNKKPGGPSL